MHAHPPPTSAILWGMFAFTQTFYWWSKAVLSARSKANPAVNTVWQWFSWQGPIVGLRFLLATAIFWWWFNDPTLVDKFFDSVAAHLSEGMWKTFIESISFPLNPGTAIMFGVAIDAILDKAIGLASKFIPALTREIPSVGGAPDAK